jgi:hypothetical protein
MYPTSSSGTGTLSGQTSLSDHSTISSASLHMAVPAVDTDSASNGRVDDNGESDDTCDYGDSDGEREVSRTMFTIELPSDSSSSLKPRVKKRGKTDEDHGLPRNGRAEGGTNANGDT